MTGALQLIVKIDHMAEPSVLQSQLSRFVKESIWRSYEKSWQGTYRKIGTVVAECNAWRDHNVLLVGGGNLINAVRSRIPFHPSDSGKPQLHVQQLEMPLDAPDILRTENGS